MNTPQLNRYRRRVGPQAWKTRARADGMLICGQRHWPSEPGRTHGGSSMSGNDRAQRPYQDLPLTLSAVPVPLDRFDASVRLRVAEILAPLALPAGLDAQARKLLHAIDIACSLEDTQRAADRAEGFVLGVETAQGLMPTDVEALYLAFDYAERVRQTELSKAELDR